MSSAISLISLTVCAVSAEVLTVVSVLPVFFATKPSTRSITSGIMLISRSSVAPPSASCISFTLPSLITRKPTGVTLPPAEAAPRRKVRFSPQRQRRRNNPFCGTAWGGRRAAPPEGSPRRRGNQFSRRSLHAHPAPRQSRIAAVQHTKEVIHTGGKIA